jgi:hypothetical protein
VRDGHRRATDDEQVAPDAPLGDHLGEPLECRHDLRRGQHRSSAPAVMKIPRRRKAVGLSTRAVA